MKGARRFHFISSACFCKHDDKLSRDSSNLSHVTMIRTGLLTIVSSQGYKYMDPKAHLDSRQQTSYTRNKWLNKRNRDYIACFVENIQNCAGCADYYVDLEYTRESVTNTDVLIAISQSGMCILDNLERKTGKTGDRAGTSMCLIESFNISFILSPVPISPRAMASISRMVLNGQRKEIVIS